MKNVVLTSKHFKSVRKMTSRQQILVYLAFLSLDKSPKEVYDRVDDIQEILGLSTGTIKQALHFLILDGHLRK